jgi:hypothetical protein
LMSVPRVLRASAGTLSLSQSRTGSLPASVLKKMHDNLRGGAVVVVDLTRCGCRFEGTYGSYHF